MNWIKLNGTLYNITQGKGEFSMEYKQHVPVLPNVQIQLMDEYKKKQEAKNK
jgi:elongation factor G